MHAEYDLTLIQNPNFFQIQNESILWKQYPHQQWH